MVGQFGLASAVWCPDLLRAPSTPTASWQLMVSLADLMAVAAGRLGWGQLSSSRLVWVVGFSRAVREGECKCFGTFQIFAYVMLVVIPLVRQVSRPAEIPRGEGDSSLCWRLSSYTAMAWIQGGICGHFCTLPQILWGLPKSWFNGYCFYFEIFLESNHFSLLPWLSPIPNHYYLCSQQVPCFLTLPPCAIYSSQSKLLKMARSWLFSVQNLPLASDLIQNKI